MDTIAIVAIVLIILLLIVLISCVRIVRQSTAQVIERLGKYHRILQTGVHLILPFFDKPVNINGSTAIDLKEQVSDFPPQPVITKDNVTMQIDTVVYYQITDPKLFCYGVKNPLQAIENLTATTLRNIVGDLELDQTLTSRDVVNAKMRAILDDATDSWGIKIHRVELKNILPPKDIRDAMEKQMRAERERREAILKAEGEKKSAILVAEGEKESAVLRAEAEKQAEILKAEAEKEAEILRATAKKVALMEEASGTAEAIKLINSAKPTEAYMALQSLDTMKYVANGQSTKIIIPGQLQNMAGMLTALSETVKDVEKKTKK